MKKHGRKYGKCRGRIYVTWKNMIKRCHNPASPQYANYGGRGIYVCDRWRGDFIAFVEDMGEKPSPSHSLDRINNDGPYSPENCRWATRKEQSNNTRFNVYLDVRGKRQTVSQWAREAGIPPYIVYGRLRAGWSAERALFEPQRVK